VERDDLVAGKACFLRIRGKFAAAGYQTFDSIPRWGRSICTIWFACPKVKGIPESNVLQLSAWLAHLRTMQKHLASLKILKAKPTGLPSIETATMRLKAKSSKDIQQKTQRLVQITETSRLDIPLHHNLNTEMDRILSNCDLIWVNRSKDAVPLQDHVLARMVATGLTRAVRLGDELVSGGGRRTSEGAPTLLANELAGIDALLMMGNELETVSTGITRAGRLVSREFYKG